jgi:hypothetical protein
MVPILLVVCHVRLQNLCWRSVESFNQSVSLEMIKRCVSAAINEQTPFRTVFSKFSLVAVKDK